MKLAFLLMMVVLFLVGCTTQECPECPHCASCCPTCNCPTQNEQPIADVVFAYFIDVGQGDSILVKYGETEMLIDCGRNSQGPNIVDFLKEKNVDRLEYLLITHPDSDHLGGCDDVLKAIPTTTVITNGQTADTVSYREVIDEIDTERHIIANTGDTWAIGKASMKVIQANNGLSDSNENSIVTKLTYGTMDILFTGDCDGKCEDLLLGKDIQSEVLKIAHHGSKYATEIDFLEKVSPIATIISVGENSYGHPAPETMDRLTQEDIPIYRTDEEGTIIVKLSDSNYEIIS